MTRATRLQTALAFRAGLNARCHNARTDGQAYWLHGSKIAEVLPGRILRLSWCGYRTQTTQAHLNAILEAWCIPVRLARSDPNDVIDFSI